MPVNPAPLQRLCDRVGVLPAYWDVWGQFHEVPADALVALLAEFGIEAETDEQASAALDDLHAAGVARGAAAGAGVWQPIARTGA